MSELDDELKRAQIAQMKQEMAQRATRNLFTGSLMLILGGGILLPVALFLCWITWGMLAR